MPELSAISKNDTMFDGGLERYISVGQSAMTAIEDVVGRLPITSILDLPCGHGRVARHLSLKYPDADIYFSDLDEEGMDFCAENFGGSAIKSKRGFSNLSLGRKFDLIWSGSLITHLTSSDTKSFFGFIADHLTDDGVAVVTTHGSVVADRLKNGAGWMYGLPDEVQKQIFSEAEQSGYGYARYPGWEDEYGISLSSSEWVTKSANDAGLQVIRHIDAGWDNHQDVFGLKLAH